MALQNEILDLLRRDPAFREELRRQLLTEEVLGLPAVVRQLVEAQRRTEERIDRLAEQVGRLAEQVDRQAQQIDRLAEQIDRHAQQIERQAQQIERLIEEVRALVVWQRGEAGRRDGERYERELVRRAPVLFNGGHGGTPEDEDVRERLTTLLQARLDEGLLPPEEDPFLADLVWWKGEQVALVEASIQVNGSDVARAAARAGTLRRAGAQALAVVIGEQWATSHSARDAESVQVAWKIGTELSPGFLALRRRASS